MSIISMIAVWASRIAEGAVLAAVVYLVNRGVKRPTKGAESSLYRLGGRYPVAPPSSDIYNGVIA